MPDSVEIGAAGGGLDRPTFERLFEACLPRVRAFVRLRRGPLVRAREETLDLVQSACADVLRDARARPLPDAEPQFLQWLFRACERKIIEHIRRLRTQKRDVAREQPVDAVTSGASRSDLGATYASICTPSAIVAGHEAAARLEAAFSELPPVQREVVLLSRLAGMSHAEIAERIGKSELAVRTILSRALTRVAARI